MCSQSHSALIFVSTVHIFNPIAHFFSHGFCLFAQRRKQAETVAGTMNNRIKNVNDRKKIENRMWLRTQRLQERVPLDVLFVFFPSANFLWWLGDLHKFCTTFLLSMQVPCLSGWFWQTKFLLESKNLVCQNQLERRGTCIDKGKRSTDFVQVTKSSQKGDWREKTK